MIRRGVPRSLPGGLLRKVRSFIDRPSAEGELLSQRVEWNPSRWEAALPGFGGQLDAVKRLRTASAPRPGWFAVTRGEVLSLADQPDDVLLFLATMIWGYGGGGRQFHVQEALGRRPPRGERPSLQRGEALDRIKTVGSLARTDPLEAFRLSVQAGSELHLPGIGVAFATKFLYMAGFDAAMEEGRPPPLILDSYVAKALGISAQPAAETYEWYLQLAHSLRPERPDLVELALFEIGLLM
ncbi:MAG: hypothetical protein M3O88_07015 [Actinomycetota bacterium]|nr:hypothetical protein [Actinomycetota bacterium]